MSGGTYCLGQVAGPSPVAVSLRMGHSFGTIRDKYIFAGDGGDQLCGRMIVGLPFERQEFGVLPPHFSRSVSHKLTLQYSESLMPKYNTYPEGFRRCFPHLGRQLMRRSRYVDLV
jgi:hypothetical protein